MALQVSIRKKLKYYHVDISFACPEEEMMVVIGPSGGGKTTLMRMIAGLEKPDAGRIVNAGEVWFDSSRGIDIPPQRRHLGYVFQEHSLFPHLSLYDNAAFAAVDKKEVQDLLDIFGISHLRKRKPHQVSGGERQRCAICQALARHPRILLLDEPFSALDFLTRQTLRQELKVLKSKCSFPVIYVTHDVAEGLGLADAILPIVQGRVEKNWLNRVLSDIALNGSRSKAARTPRLSIAF